jgi:hypothetical protein
MLRLDIRHIAFAAWATASGGLGVLIGKDLDWGRRPRLDVPMASVLAPDSVGIDLLGEYKLVALDKNYQQTNERPLFVPSRRPAPPPPPPPPPAPPPKPTMQKGQFQMVGALILPEASYVWLREAAGGRTRRVEQGQTINGVLVQSVESETVTLTQYDESETVMMKVAPTPKGHTASPGRPAGAAQVHAQVVQQEDKPLTEIPGRGRFRPGPQ